MTRSLLFAVDAMGGLRIASAGQAPLLEVLAIPSDYADAEALAIIDAVRSEGILQMPPGATKPIRITWSAIVERGIASGVLAEQDVQP